MEVSDFMYTSSAIMGSEKIHFVLISNGASLC